MVTFALSLAALLRIENVVTCAVSIMYSPGDFAHVYVVRVGSKFSLLVTNFAGTNVLYFCGYAEKRKV